MSKHKRLTHDQKIIKALEKIKTPIVDELRNLSIFFKARSRSNETGMGHIAKNYHGLDPSDIELLVDCIKNPIEHIKDRRYPKTYCYYQARKLTKIITSKLLLRLKTILKQGIYLRYSLHQKLKISSGINRLL